MARRGCLTLFLLRCFQVHSGVGQLIISALEFHVTGNGFFLGILAYRIFVRKNVILKHAVD